MGELKTKWPVWVDDPNQHDYENEIDYHSARADAAIERLRVAVEALVQLHERAESFSDDEAIAWDALAAIGPIPGEQT